MPIFSLTLFKSSLKPLLVVFISLGVGQALAQEPLTLFDVPELTEPKADSQTHVLKASARITLAEAFILAEQNNPQIKATKEQVVQAQASVKIARQIPNPEVQAIYGFGPATTRLGNAQTTLISQTLEMGGKRRARTELARSQAILVEAQLESLRQSIRAEVRRSYVELIAAEESIANLTCQEKLLLELVQIAKKRFEAGASPESEVILATLAHDQIIPLKAQADGQIEQSRVAFDILLGKSLPPQFQIQKSVMLQGYVQKIPTESAPKMPDLDAMISKAFDQRQDLQAATQQVNICQKQVKVTHSLKYPDVQVGVGYAFLPASQKYDNPFTQGVMTSLQTTLPAYHNQKMEMQRDQAALRQSEIQLSFLKQQIEKEVRTALIALQTAIVNISLYEQKLLPASDEGTQLAKLSYKVGKTGLANVILAQQATQQVRTGYMNALLDYQRAVSDLEKAIGGPFE